MERREVVRPLSNIQVGTLGGTLCSIFVNLTLDDIVKTAILAAVGAMVSFVISKLLEKITQSRARPPNRSTPMTKKI